MSKEHFIRGKIDDAHHDGRRGGLRRLFESEQEMIDFWSWVWPEMKEQILSGKGIEEIGPETTQSDIEVSS